MTALGALGHELYSKTTEKQQSSTAGGAESGARDARIDNDLAQVIAAWPGLTDAQRQQVLRIVRGE